MFCSVSEPVTSNPLRSVLQVAETALAVRHVATTVLWSPSPAARATDVRREMTDKGFDAAPVDEEPVSRYVTPELLDDGTRTVDEVARPIAAPELLTSDLGLADGVLALKGQPFRLSSRDGASRASSRGPISRNRRSA